MRIQSERCDTFNTNFSIRNLQLSVGRLRLPFPTFLTHVAAEQLGNVLRTLWACFMITGVFK